MRKILLPLLMLLASTSFAATGWINDELYVPLRAGAGNQFKILHKGLKSGTPLEILEMDDGAEWARVRYQDIEGYIPAQYVSRTPTGNILYERLQTKYQKVESELNDTRSKLREVTQERDKLAGENKTLDANLSNRSKELSNLKEVAADPIRLDEANRKLNEQLVQLRTQLDTAQAENSMLRNDNRSSQWLVGVLILAIGSLIGWLLKGRSGRARSSWA